MIDKVNVKIGSRVSDKKNKELGEQVFDRNPEMN